VTSISRRTALQTRPTSRPGNWPAYGFPDSLLAWAADDGQAQALNRLAPGDPRDRQSAGGPGIVEQRRSQSRRERHRGRPAAAGLHTSATRSATDAASGLTLRADRGLLSPKSPGPSCSRDSPWRNGWSGPSEDSAHPRIPYRGAHPIYRPARPIRSATCLPDFSRRGLSATAATTLIRRPTCAPKRSGLAGCYASLCPASPKPTAAALMLLPPRPRSAQRLDAAGDLVCALADMIVPVASRLRFTEGAALLDNRCAQGPPARRARP